MSFAEDKNFKYLLREFKSVCETLGYACNVVNEENADERIVPEIIEHIQKAAFVIADLSEPSPNVYYELGSVSRRAMPATARAIPVGVRDGGRPYALYAARAAPPTSNNAAA